MTKKRRNSLQLRLTPQNEALAERVMHEYLYKNATSMTWKTFGNLLISRGLKSLKRELEKSKRTIEDE